MNIALIDPSLFTLPYDRDLARGLEGAGHHVTLYGRRPGPDDGGTGGISIAEHFYRLADKPAIRAAPSGIRLGAKGADHAWSMLRLLTRLRRNRPDVVHFQWLALPLIDGRLLPAFRRIAPLVLTVHDTNPFNGNPSARLQSAGFLSALRRFDALIVHTRQGLERLTARGLASERIKVLPHGLIEDTSTPQPVLDHTEAPETTFLLFGKMKPYKGIDLLIKAFAQLSPELQNRARLRIVGKPYFDLGPLHSLASQLGVADRVAIEPRFVADDELPALFGPGTVAVFPYREIEASGVLTLAIRYGRPIVASRLGGFAETIVDGEHGHLVDPGDIVSLAAALRHMAQEPQFVASCAAAVQHAARSGPKWADVARDTAALYATVRSWRENPYGG
jgi:glycosyltransferase involved in cell wall biosynthesis